MAASRREKSPAQNFADREATDRERKRARNSGTGTSFLKRKTMSGNLKFINKE